MSNIVSFDEFWDPSNHGGALIRRVLLLGRIRYVNISLGPKCKARAYFQSRYLRDEPTFAFAGLTFRRGLLSIFQIEKKKN